jgi:excisionase family DNA binding protein
MMRTYVNEVAEKLKVSRRSVGRMIESGALPAIRLRAAGGNVRIADSDLRKFLDERRTVTVPFRHKPPPQWENQRLTLLSHSPDAPR